MDHPLPSPPQLALAIAIVKHKPAELTLKDYILQLRTHIKTAREDKYPKDKDSKYLDSVSFWQSAYERSEAEQSKLLDRIYDLERRIEGLQAGVQRNLHGLYSEGEGGVEVEKTARTKTKTTKRKAGASEMGMMGSSLSSSKKRAKTQGYNAAGAAAGNESAEHVEYIEESTAPFMRQLFALQRALLKRSTRADIVHGIAGLCRVSGAQILSVLQHGEASSAPQARKKVAGGVLRIKQPNGIDVLRRVEAAFRVLAQGVKRIATAGSEVDDAARDAGVAVRHVVGLYGSMLSALERHCGMRSEYELAAQTKADARAPLKRKATTRLKKSIGRSTSQTSKLNTEDELAAQVARMLNALALSLDPSCGPHRKILEGCLYFLLSRIGKLLSLFTFQDLHLRADLRADPSKLPLPKGFADFDLSEMSLFAAQMEAKQLVWVVERMLAILCSGESDFVSRVKGKLQSTLLAAVYGTDADWGPTLERPDSPHEDSPDKVGGISHVPDQPVPEWFTQEVWRLLGWDILARSAPVNEKSI